MSDDPRKAIVGAWRLVHSVEYGPGGAALPLRSGCRRIHHLFRVAHVIRCQFVFSGKNDELTPDFLDFLVVTTRGMS